MVRLGEHPSAQHVCKPMQFQFQYGSIGSKTELHAETIKLLFQFQYGSIGSGKLEANPSKFQVSIPVWFDWEHMSVDTIQNVHVVSIPVWFDWEKLAESFSTMLSSFNSSMVRLGVKRKFTRSVILPRFQFQYGSIGSQYDRVRFTNISSFNSSMVRLGGWYCWRRKVNKFVSIPVWFDWETNIKSWNKPIYLFQFQYGSIGSVGGLLRTLWHTEFQFQYGSIGRK